jgi:hypothetical protein
MNVSLLFVGNFITHTLRTAHRPRHGVRHGLTAFHCHVSTLGPRWAPAFNASVLLRVYEVNNESKGVCPSAPHCEDVLRRGAIYTVLNLAPEEGEQSDSRSGRYNTKACIW